VIARSLSSVFIHSLSQKSNGTERMSNRNLRSRSAFRRLNQSDSGSVKSSWRRRNNIESSESLVVVQGMQQQKDPMSDARQSRSRSPVRSRRPPTRDGVSPWRPLSHHSRTGPRSTVCKSEINVFQQLFLDKYEDNSAIEILLDCADKSVPPSPDRSWPPSSDEAASARSTTPASRAGRKEKAASNARKRNFLDRFFFKSPRKPEPPRGEPSAALPAICDTSDSTKENSLPSSTHGSLNDDDDTSSGLKDLTVPKTRIRVEDLRQSGANDEQCRSLPQSRSVSILKTHNPKSHEADRFDAGSNVSSLSGTRGSSRLTPITLDRHESLGLDSIMDIRKCLKEMERQLGQASHKGQTVSRKKVIRALFMVADSLEDDEEREILKSELKAVMRIERIESSHPLATAPIRVATDDEKSELTTSDDEDATFDCGGFVVDGHSEDSLKDASSFNLMASVGNFFGVNPNNGVPVEEVLDDLLWTEFVASRQGNMDSRRQPSRASSKKSHSRTLQSKKGQTVSLRLKQCEVPPRDECDCETTRSDRSRSWWRKQTPSASVDKSETKLPHDDGEDGSASTSSEELQSYLPESISANRRPRDPRLDRSTSEFSSNPRYKVNLIDTDSRQGFEMDNFSHGLTGTDP
jgi:hypothetical protein